MIALPQKRGVGKEGQAAPSHNTSLLRATGQATSSHHVPPLRTTDPAAKDETTLYMVGGFVAIPDLTLNDVIPVSVPDVTRLKVNQGDEGVSPDVTKLKVNQGDGGVSRM